MPFNLSPIKMEWFEDLKGYKTKLNWFLFEFALDYYNFIRQRSELEAFRKQHNEQQIAQYCAYYARRLQPGLLKYIRGRTKRMIFYEEHVHDFYPYYDEAMVFTLNKVAIEAMACLLETCVACGQMCLDDYEAGSRFFNDYKD